MNRWGVPPTDKTKVGILPQEKTGGPNVHCNLNVLKMMARVGDLGGKGTRR